MEADFQVGIVGAGFAGLVAALRLKKSGRDSFVIFERASEVGGTWRDNIYPGCACDIASPLYSFADEQNPEWSQLYSEQPEILDYLKGVVSRNKLYPHIRFQSDVVEARFLEEEGCWLVRDRQGNNTTVRMLLLGMGPLNRPYIPAFPGLEEFKGNYFHSSAWDTSYDVGGKKVAVIGTGASAIQIIPTIAPEVAHLTVLQRTPAWVAPRYDRKFSRFSRWLLKKAPFLQRLQREVIYRANELIGLGFIGHKIINRLFAYLSLRKLRKEVKDPALREKLTPNYIIGCKRILRSDNYYPTFNRQNVKLVTDRIERFTPEGILTADGTEHQLDAVVFGTGFIAADIDFYTKILGRNGRNLVAEWKEKGAEAFLGTTVSGFPNLALILGPNTGLGHNSVVLMMEVQMNYIMQYIHYLEKNGKGLYLDVKEQEQLAYNERLLEKFKGTVWASGCRSWYVNKEGKNTTLYPRLVTAFKRQMRKFDPAAYHLVQPRVNVPDKNPVKA
ncbi:flavin-containing monooxygenase [Pontibacter toksunensis]|uniref:Flavin-containing monooxygenase n=1 Tax=Pontibacter toksunensis TaxID=1332631 RepID=A0ABW6BUI2_9BACT